MDEKWSLEAWQAETIRTYEFSDKLAIRYRVMDPLAVLGASAQTNPLIAIAMSEGGRVKFEINTEMIRDASKLFNEIAVAVIVDPPLLEQGHKNGIPVSAIPLAVKQHIFEDLVGGIQALDAAKNVVEEQNSGVVAAPNGQSLRAATIRHAAHPDAFAGLLPGRGAGDVGELDREPA